MARPRAKGDDVDPDEIVLVTVAIGAGEWLTLTPARESDDSDAIDVDLDPAAKRLVLARLRAALDELDRPRWESRRPLDG